nr:uncharacterized protein LOC117274533 [Nicotiana tomentosiformis]
MKKKKKDHERMKPKKEKNLVLKADNNDSSGEDADMTYLTKQFQKMVRRNLGIPKRGSSLKPKVYDLFHKCGKPGHFIKDYTLLKQDQHKHNTDKTANRNPVRDRLFKKKDVTDNIVKQDLATWGDSSSEFGEDDEQGDTSMIEVENETAELVPLAKRFKNIYVADFESLHNVDLTCLSVVDDDAELWHSRFGHASFSLLNKLVKKNLVHDQVPLKQNSIRIAEREEAQANSPKNVWMQMLCSQ